MNTFAERLLENDLAEMLGGKRPPDLTRKALARLGGAAPVTADKPLAPLIKPQFRRRWVRWLEAACIILALGGITWLLWPGNRNTDLPAGLKASPDAAYAVSKAAIRLDKGWLYVETGAPTIMVGDDRVDHIEGRAVIKARGLTLQEALDISRQASLRDLSDKEKDMLSNPKRWLAIGGVSICIFSGSVMVNGQVVDSGKYVPNAEAEHKIEKTEKVEAPKDGDAESVNVKAGNNFKVIETVNGQDSDIDEREYQMIRSERDLNAVLKRHRKDGWDKPPVTADFKKQMVLAIFLGRCGNTPAVTIDAATTTEIVVDGIHQYLHVVRFSAVPYQSLGGADDVTPYGFFVLPSTVCRVALEERVVTGMHDSPRWERRRVFDTGAGVVPAVMHGVGKTHFSDDTKYPLNNRSIGGDDPLCLYLDTAEKFDEAWKKHAPGTTKPWEVNFEKQVVIAVFCGQTMNSWGLALEQRMIGDDTRILRFNNNIDMQRSSATYTSPCMFVLVSKDGRTNVIEFKNHLKLERGQWIARDKDDPEQWVEKARLSK